MNHLCIIPARGGSKRIPRKNIRLLEGKPIIAYPISVAIKTGCFDRVIVSTDDEEIASVAREFGADVPFLRSKRTSDDHAPVSAALLETVERLTEVENETISPKYITCVYPTAALLTQDVLSRGVDMLVSGTRSAVIAITPFEYPIQRALRFESDRIQFALPEFLETRSQDLEPRYHDAAAFFSMRTDYLKQNSGVFGSDTGAIVLSRDQVQDVDTMDDWNELTFKMRLRNRKA
jgi:N-acylneuraminate cytidylyltransferase